MRAIFAAMGISFLVACQNNQGQNGKNTHLNAAVQSVVRFVADSINDCPHWLAKDYTVRKFFTEDDSAAQLLTQHFSHDQIVSWFLGMDTTSVMGLEDYLKAENQPFFTSEDSLNTCAKAINTVVFSHQNNEAILLLVKFKANLAYSYTLLLERPTQNEAWYIADTLSQYTAPK